MVSISETGHAVNIANFNKLIVGCEEFGAVYNPGNSDLSIGSMRAKLTSVSALHGEYISAMAATKIPINEREILFAELGKLVVRSYNMLVSTQASELMKRDAKGYMMKITGRNMRKDRLVAGVSKKVRRISNSHLSFDQRVENFDKLVNLYKADGSYTPNETALQIEALEGMLNNLREANEMVNVVVIDAVMKRMARDHGLYDAGAGLIDLALGCKMYVKGLFGAKSPEAESVVGIKFRRMMRLNAV